jgi:hypothetical protein
MYNCLLVNDEIMAQSDLIIRKLRAEGELNDCKYPKEPEVVYTHGLVVEYGA